MSPLFTWSESFLTRVPSVDEQHRRLVDMINDLGELVLGARDLDVGRVAAVQDQLLDYVRVHFADEEALMERVGLDPRYAEPHRAEHRAFAVEIAEMVEAGWGRVPERARALTDYLVHWLAYHILDVDQSMARQVRAVEAGASPRAAFEGQSQATYAGTDPLLAALSGLFHAVSQRNRELRALNRELDQRVALRTGELAEANRRLHALATQDDLTGLPNRRFAMLTLARLWAERARYGGPLSVLLLDADRFKEVNDRFGHAQGDVVLRALAERIQGAARASDVACRLGGDEFLVVCPRSGRADAAAVAARILEARRPLPAPDGSPCWDGAVSIGVAEAGASTARVEELLAAADRALYAAKGRGGDQLVDAEAA